MAQPKKISPQILLCTFDVTHGVRCATRLTRIKENAKFQNNKNGEHNEPTSGLEHLVDRVKEHHNVNDKPDNHNYDLLKKLVLPNGSIFRAQLPGRPTCDSLLFDPERDRTSLLKIWNMKKCVGVVGVFNSQCDGWCKAERKTCIQDTSLGTLTSSVCASDVDLINKVAGAEWHGETIVYA